MKRDCMVVYTGPYCLILFNRKCNCCKKAVITGVKYIHYWKSLQWRLMGKWIYIERIFLDINTHAKKSSINVFVVTLRRFSSRLPYETEHRSIHRNTRVGIFKTVLYICKVCVIYIPRSLKDMFTERAWCIYSWLSEQVRVIMSTDQQKNEH